MYLKIIVHNDWYPQHLLGCCIKSYLNKRHTQNPVICTAAKKIFVVSWTSLEKSYLVCNDLYSNQLWKYCLFRNENCFKTPSELPTNLISIMFSLKNSALQLFDVTYVVPEILFKACNRYFLKTHYTSDCNNKQCLPMSSIPRKPDFLSPWLIIPLNLLLDVKRGQ